MRDISIYLTQLSRPKSEPRMNLEPKFIQIYIQPVIAILHIWSDGFSFANIIIYTYSIKLKMRPISNSCKEKKKKKKRKKTINVSYN